MTERIYSTKDAAYLRRKNNRFFKLRKCTSGSDPDGHMTIKELAESINKETGKYLTTIDKVERGEINPSLDFLLSYHQYFKVSYEYLLDDETATRYQENFFDSTIYGLEEDSLWNLSMINYHKHRLKKKIKDSKLELQEIEHKIDTLQCNESDLVEACNDFSLYQKKLEYEKLIILLEKNHRHLSRIQMIINFLISNIDLDLELDYSSLLEKSNSMNQFFRSFDRACFCEFETFTNSFVYDDKGNTVYQLENGEREIAVINNLVPDKVDEYREDNISMEALQDGLLFEFLTHAKTLRNEYKFPILNDPSRQLAYYNLQKEFFSGVGYDIYRSKCTSKSDKESFHTTLKKRYGIKKGGVKGNS